MINSWHWFIQPATVISRNQNGSACLGRISVELASIKQIQFSNRTWPPEIPYTLHRVCRNKEHRIVVKDYQTNGRCDSRSGYAISALCMSKGLGSIKKRTRPFTAAGSERRPCGLETVKGRPV